ncbi:MAG TPA: hypothetical protein H9902_08005 [Candidatus Stackebrandtia faecavium]|nr:hypothetical protein [Candidatus Stackebrandtia faecavium]
MGIFRSLRVFGYSVLVYALAISCLALIEHEAKTIALIAVYGGLLLACELAMRWLAIRHARYTARPRHR